MARIAGGTPMTFSLDGWNIGDADGHHEEFTTAEGATYLSIFKL